MRQPSVLATSPPKEGPTAGAMAAISEAIPIMKPILSKGACSRTMLNIRGSAMPAPTPWSSLPSSRIEKLGATMHVTVATMKTATANRNRCFIGKRFLRKDDSGMVTASMRRYPVVIHCTVAMSTPNWSISVGNVTVRAVSTTTPVKDMSPAAMTDRMSFRSSFLSNCCSICCESAILSESNSGFVYVAPGSDVQSETTTALRLLPHAGFSA